MRGRHRALVAIGAVAIVAVALIAVFASLVNRPPATADSPLLGRPAPVISGRDLLTGRAERIGGADGRFVVVSFFASWCVPCANEAPQLSSFAFDNRHDASVLGVVFDDTGPDATGFLRHYGASWPAVADPGSRFAVAYGVADPPQSFLVDPAGVVVAWFPGAVTLKNLDAELAKARANGACERAARWSIAAAAVVAAVFLAIGSVHGPSSTDAARIAHLEAILKCPSCDDLSIGQSSAPTARALDAIVAADVRAGESDQQIENYVLGRYPGSILVPTGGLDALAIGVPLAAIALGAAGLSVVLWRRRRPLLAQLPSEDDEALVRSAGGR